MAHFFQQFSFQKCPEAHGLCDVLLNSKLFRATTPYNAVHVFNSFSSQKGSGCELFLICLFPNLPCAATACNFSSVIWPGGSAHTVQAYFPTPQNPKTLAKQSVSRRFYLFVRVHFFFRCFFFFDVFSLLFSDSSHLCFFICPYCRKFDFQISVSYYHYFYLYYYY